MLTFPAGNVKTDRPGPPLNPYNIPWTDVSRWEPWFSEAAAESAVPAKLIAAMAIIESDANHTWPSGPNAGQVIEVFDNFPQDGPSVGIMQVKPQLWGDILPGADAFTPQGNIRLGARLMRNFIDKRGSWEDAIRKDYHPGVSPTGTTPQMYVDTVNSLMSEMGQTVAAGNGVDVAGQAATITTQEALNAAIANGAQVFVQSPEGLLLRAAPSLAEGTPILALMPNGAAFALTGGKRIGFVKATLDGMSGWAYAEYLAAQGVDFAAGSKATVTAADGLNLRAEPSLADGVPILALIPIGSVVTLTGDNRLGFVEGVFNGRAGWAYGEFLSPEPVTVAVVGGSLFQAMLDAGMCISQRPFDSFSHSICDCYDFAIPIGTPIPALAAGTVIFSAAVDDVYRPNRVVVRTAQLGDHLYAHLSQRNVNVGDVVAAGTIIGLSGSENGPHLHLQLDHGFSPLGLSLTQTLEREGFNVGAFSGC
jgi:uncharacterized protein YraI